MDETKNTKWGRDLPGGLQDKWPRDGDGEFEEPVFLKHCTSLDMADELRVNMLDAYGIPCVKQYPVDGSFGRVMMGMSGGGTDVFVPKSMFENAKELCEGVPDEENV